MCIGVGFGPKRLLASVGPDAFFGVVVELSTSWPFLDFCAHRQPLLVDQVVAGRLVRRSFTWFLLHFFPFPWSV